MKTKCLASLILFLLCIPPLSAQEADSVYFTTGFRTGELTDTSVVVWTRLCSQAEPVPIQHAQNEAPFRDPINFNNELPVHEMDGAVRGSFGQIKVTLRSGDSEITTDWEYVSSYKDYTFKKEIGGLKPATRYAVQLMGRRREEGPVTEISGHFTTAPSQDEAIPVLFTSSTCQYFWDYDDPVRGFKIYDQMLTLEPLFHCQTGDYVYYDKPGPMAYTVEKARHKWHAINAWPSLVDFYAATPLYIQKDDHDITWNDASPASSPFGEITFQDGLALWYEQTPTIVERPYRTHRWGKDLQIWFVEGREYRSDNDKEDGADKTIWGEEQKAWFTRTVEASDATFKILMSPTPVVGPDRATGKSDNHSNEAFSFEGEWLRNFLAAREYIYVVNGDRHWQYVSEDEETGVLEFSQGPSSDAHAQGWKEGDKRPEHKFLRVKGGFLAVQVYRNEGKAFIKFMHYDVEGNIVNEEVIEKQL